MKQIVFILFVLLFVTTSAYAQELYKCTDQKGNVIITSQPEDRMKCEPKDSNGKKSFEEESEEDYLERQKTITEREKTYTEREQAITEYEKAAAERERAHAERERQNILRKPNTDVYCERNCETGLNSCKSDCEWKKRGYGCSSNCIDVYEICLRRCND